jgi:hypothetical protein
MNKLFSTILIFIVFPGSTLQAQNKDGAVILPDTVDFPFIRITGVTCTGNKLIPSVCLLQECICRLRVCKKQVYGYNPLNNKMLISWGAGIDFVSYYDLVLRIEYAWTSNWHNELFIGFGMPI